MKFECETHSFLIERVLAGSFTRMKTSDPRLVLKIANTGARKDNYDSLEHSFNLRE